MEWAKRITLSNWFHHTIPGVILLNALVIGLDTSPDLTAQYHDWFVIANQVFLGLVYNFGPQAGGR